MKLKEIFDWFADRPIHFCALSLSAMAMFVCLTACVFFISSCAAKSDEHYYKYRTESSKDFWQRDR